jgi:N-acetylneuraminate synthase
MDSLVAARLLGAVVLEKHFTHDTTLPGNDHYHAMDEAGLARYRRREAQMLRLLGPTTHKGWIPSEEPARRNARRSLVLVRDLPAGHRLREEDLVAKRPGTGVSPMQWREIVGTTLVRALPEDHVLTWDDVRRP